jgi:hypothetical protein
MCPMCLCVAKKKTYLLFTRYITTSPKPKINVSLRGVATKQSVLFLPIQKVKINVRKLIFRRQFNRKHWK